MHNTGAAPCRQFKRSPEIPHNGARGISPPLSFRRSAAEPRNLSSNGTRRNEAGDIGAQSLNSADTSLAIPACTPARDDRATGSVKDKAFPPYTRHTERQRKISVSVVSEGKGSQYQSAGRRVPGPDMTCSRVIIGKYRDSSPGVRMTGGAGRKHVLILAVSCRQFKGSPKIPPQWRTRYSTSTVISSGGQRRNESYSSWSR